MVRILQITEALKQRYGVTSVIMSYYRSIDKTRVQFDFLVNEAEQDIAEEIKKLGGRIYYFPELTITNFFNVRSSLRDFYTQHGKDYVAVHSAFTQLEFLTLGEAARVGIRHRISHSHATSYTIGGKLKTIRNRIMHELGRRYATDYFACGDEAGLFMFGKKRVESSNYYKMRNAIRLDRFTFNTEKRIEIRTQYGWQNDFVIACVGSLIQRKNQLFLIKLMPELIQLIPNVRLVLIGEGPSRHNIEMLIEDLGIQNKCNLLGTSDHVEDFLSAVDCYALPSLMEGLPISVIEAQAAGLPCMLSESITREVNVTGLCNYLSLSDSEEWIKTICRIRNYIRNQFYDIITNAGYNIEKEARILSDKYESMGLI